ILNAATEQIVVFDLAAGKFVRRIALPNDGPFNEALLAASDPKSCVFTWSDGGTHEQRFLVFDLDKGKVKHSCSLKVDRPLKSLLSAPASDYLFALDSAGSSHAIDVKNAKELPLAANLTDFPLAFTPDGKSLYLRKPGGG